MKDLSLARIVRTGLRFLAVAAAFSSLTGCVTRGYKLADKSVPPAVPLELASTPIASAEPKPSAAGEAAATVHTVIIHQGPGSWKREAYWDEYVVSIANRGATPLVVSAASLTSKLSEPVTPGDDPWKLDRAGKTWWKSNAAEQTKTMLLLGTGTVAGAGVFAVGALSGGVFGPMTTAGAAAAGVGAAAVVTLPIVAVSSVVMNVRGKHRIEAEFARRRLILPLTLAPGETRQGSLFFRITPAPQRLTLSGRAADEPREVAVDLAPISGLHLALPVAPAVAKQ